MEALKSKTILKKNGTKYTGIVKKDAFKDVHWIVYYFGAKRCSDCVKFTPLLRDVYVHIKSTNESFEILYVSSDKSEEEMKEFAAESHPDWYFLYGGEDDDSSEDFTNAWNLRNDLGISGIPSVVVVKDDEIVCSFDGVSDVLSKGVEVVAHWKQTQLDKSSYNNAQTQPKRATEDAIIPNCCKISRFKPWAKTQPADVVKGMKLIRKVGKDFVEESADVTLKNAEIVGFYFSAHWCGPCHAFTPVLRDCYDELKKDQKSFEIVFIPTGESEDEMKKYMQDLHGDWLGILCDEKAENILARKFEVEGIPALRIVNKTGDLVSVEGDQDVQASGTACFPRWMEGKPGATSEEIQNYWALQENENGFLRNIFSGLWSVLDRIWSFLARK